MAVRQQEIPRTTRKTKNTVAVLEPMEQPVNPLGEASNDVNLAYSAFIEAKEELSEAVREQETQGKEASRNAEKRYKVYRSIIDEAFNEREKAELQAMDAYRGAMEKAGVIYREAVQTALNKCKKTTDTAWATSLGILTQNPQTTVKPADNTWQNKIIVKSRHIADQTKKLSIKWYNKSKDFINDKVLSPVPAEKTNQVENK